VIFWLLQMKSLAASDSQGFWNVKLAHCASVRSFRLRANGPLTALCTECGYKILLAELRRINGERCRCPKCGKSFCSGSQSGASGLGLQVREDERYVMLKLGNMFFYSSNGRCWITASLFHMYELEAKRVQKNSPRHNGARQPARRFRRDGPKKTRLLKKP
jgi:hypothetical protein